MISDDFIAETPQPEVRRAISSRDGSGGRLSTGSFASPSINENFGDWGFNPKEMAFLMNDEDVGDVDELECNRESESPEYPFSVQNKDGNGGENDGFIVKDRRSFPKLPVSQREIRKVRLHGNQQPMVIFETGDNDGESDFIVSPMGYKSPLSTSQSLRKHRTMPTRHVKRSISDVGSFGLTGLTKVNVEKATVSPPNVRDLWSAQKGCELSLSFSERRRPSTNRRLLEQIAEGRQSYRNLLQFEDDEDEDDYDIEVNFSKAQNHPVDDEIQDHIMDADEIVEGTMPLKSSPEVTSRKRSTSKSRIKKNGSTRTKEEFQYFDEFGHRRPTRKGSYGSRSMTNNGTRRSRTRKHSLSDSDRRSSKKSESTETTSSTNGTSKVSTDPERQSLLDAVRERRFKNQRRITEKDNQDNLPRRLSKRHLNSGSNKNIGEAKKTSERDKYGTSEECKKNNSRRSRPTGRRASISMTGNIVDSQSNNRRRSSMDHNSPPGKPTSRRRATMDHIPNPTSSPSSNHSPSDHLNKARYKPQSNTEISDFAEDKYGIPIPPQNPFGEEGTVTTQELSDSYHHQHPTSANSIGTPSRKASVSSREREPPRRNRSTGEKSKSFTNRRKLGRNRSDLARQNQRCNPAKKEDKAVSVEEILALVATTPKPEISRRPASSRPKRWHSCNQLKGANSAELSDNSGHKKRSSRSNGKTIRDPRERSRERSLTSSPRKKSRSRSKRSTIKIRKGKRVDVQPEKETSSLEDNPGKTNNPVLSRKESRRHLKSRRGSNK